MVAFFFWWGSTEITRIKGRGEFLCPTCGVLRPYRRRVVRRFFTLCSIPLFATQTLADHIECEICLGAVPPTALSGRPREPGGPQGAEPRQALLELLALVVCSGVGNAHSKLKAAVRAAAAFPGMEVREADMLRVCERVRSGGPYAVMHLPSAAGILTDADKRAFLQCAILVAVETKHLEKEWPTILAAARLLGLTPEQTSAILRDLRAGE